MKNLRKTILLVTIVIIAGLSAYYFYSQRVRVVLIGLDGATWDIINPLIEKGKLPNFKKLMDEGSYGILKSIQPMFSPALWTSIATGKKFSKHGIKDFVINSEETGKEVPVTSNLRKTKAIWNILSDKNKKGIILNYPVTYPPEEINGIIVSRIGFSKKWLRCLKEPVPPMVYPNEYQILLNELTDKALPRSGGDLWLNDVPLVKELTLYFLKKDWDLLITYSNAPDVNSHLYWKYMEPEKFSDPKWNLTQDNIIKYRNRIEDIYKDTDVFIGEIIDKLEKDTLILIVSDHGQKAAEELSPENPEDSGVHDINGIIIISGKNIRKGYKTSNASILDITPTILYLLNLPVAKDMDGKILRDTVTPIYRLLHPIKYISTYEDKKINEEAQPVTSPFDEEIIKRLKSLGYIQ